MKLFPSPRTLIVAIGMAGLFATVACGKQETERRRDFTVHGVDVSHYQSCIEWDQLALQDIHFAFIKATEGKTLVDSLFTDNWENARTAGLHRGAYHFFRPQSPPLDQVLHFIRVVRLEPGDLPPVLDVETLDGCSPDTIIPLIRTWLTLVEAHYGVKPILYSNQKFYHRHLAGHFDDYPLWIARYSRDFPELGPERTWQFWQYGDRARLQGVDGYVDLNVYSGSHSDFASLLLRSRSKNVIRSNP